MNAIYCMDNERILNMNQLRELLTYVGDTVSDMHYLRNGLDMPRECCHNGTRGYLLFG